jgi:hypothetical protein
MSVVYAKPQQAAESPSLSPHVAQEQTGKSIRSTDTTSQPHNADKQDEAIVEAQGRDGQTIKNNLDPARNSINPQLLTESEFLANSLCYGLRVPTGATSTWDRGTGPDARAFQKALLARYGERAREFAIANQERQRTQFGQLADVVGTGDPGALDTMIGSVNNELSARGVQSGSEESKTKDTSGNNADGSHRYDEGRQRGQNPTEPAHHFAAHEPNTWDRVHGGLKVAAGAVRMDQDIKTQGKAEFNGETRDHY